MILVQNKTYTASFTFENKKNRLPLTVFWGLRHPKKTQGTPLRGIKASGVRHCGCIDNHDA